MGKIVGFSKERKEEIFNKTIQFWDDATTKLMSQFNLVDERERLSRGQLPKDLESAFAGFKDRCALVPTDIYDNLNSLKSHIRLSLFNKKPFFKLSHPHNPMLRDEAIRKAELTLQQMNDKAADGAGMAANADPVVHQALYAGLSCVFTKWVKQIERKAVRDETTGAVLTNTKTGAPIFRNEVVAQYAEDIPLDIRRVRWNTNAADVKDIRTVGYHSLMTKQDLIALNRIADNHYQFDEKELQESTFPMAKYQELGPFNLDMETNDRKISDDMVEVQHVRGLFRFEDNSGNITYQDLIVEIANRTLIVALKENDLPMNGWDLFTFVTVNRELGRIWAMGVVEPIVDTFVEKFVKRNQSLDEANRGIHVKYMADSSAAEDLPEYLEHGDDQILMINAAGAGLPSVQAAMGVLPRPNTAYQTFQQAESLGRNIQQGMLLSDYLQGSDPSAAETATGVAALVSGGRALTSHLIEKIADSYLRPTAKKKLILWSFFLGDKQHEIADQNGEILTIMPGELDLPYNVSVETSLAATSPAAQRRFVEVYPIISSDPHYDGQVVRETLNEILDLPNGERLLVNPKQLENDINNESIALGFGVPQQVDVHHNHVAHLEGHQEYLGYIEEQQQRNDLGPEEIVQVQELRTDVLEEHMEEHMQILEQQQEALGNSKELGGNTGNVVQPDGAANNLRTQSGRGNFTPSENRQ